MQSVQTPPAPPAPPAPQVTVQVAPRVTGVTGVPAPLTREQVASLRARRTELSNQLQSADGRRYELAQRLLNSTCASREGLEQRISVLDQRIMRLELDIAETGRQLTAAPSGLAGTTTHAAAPAFLDRLDPGDVAGLSATFFIVVLGPLSLALARLVWKRGSLPRRPVAATDPASTARLERIEQAVDTIALEVERVSEGQRFVTRLLAEGRTAQGLPALGAGVAPAEPVRVPNTQAVPVSSRGRG